MKKGTIYTSPSVRVIEVAQNRTLCTSEGTTQNYGTESIWEQGTDNE